jgi:hypothetical protein
MDFLEIDLFQRGTGTGQAGAAGIGFGTATKWQRDRTECPMCYQFATAFLELSAS